MSYTTGSADSYQDLLAKIRTIAEAVGWITRAADASTWLVSSADGNANYVIGVLTTDDSQHNFWSVASRGPCMAVTNCKSINTGLSPWQQPGQDFRDAISGQTAILCFGQNMTGPFSKFHVFATAQYVHVVVEAVTGAFGHLLIGTIDKDGAVYQGGSYNAASQYVRPVNSDTNGNDSSGNGVGQPFAMYPFNAGRYPYYSNSRIRVENVDNLGSPSCDVFASPSGSSGSEGTAVGPWLAGYSGSGMYGEHPDCGLIEASANSLGGNTMMVPAAIYHFGAQQRLRYIGVIPDHAICNMQFLAPGDVVTYGTDEWMVFPAFKKGTSPINTSLNAGVAYKLRR